MKRQALRRRLDELATLLADGALTVSSVRRESSRLRTRLVEVEQAQAATSWLPVLGELVGAHDVRAVWQSLSLSRKRAVVDTLVSVRILPSGRRGNAFDPDLVEVTAKL